MMFIDKEYFSITVGQDFDVLLKHIHSWISRNPGAVVVAPKEEASDYLNEVRKIAVHDDKPDYQIEVCIMDEHDEYVADREQVRLILISDLAPHELYDSLYRPTEAYRNEVLRRAGELVAGVDRDLRFRFDRACQSRLEALQKQHEKLRGHYVRACKELSEADDEDDEFEFKPRHQWTAEDEEFYAAVRHVDESSIRETRDAIWRWWKAIESQICAVTGEEVDERCPLTGKLIYW